VIRIHQRNDRILPYQLQDETGQPINLDDAHQIVFVISTHPVRKRVIEKHINEGITIVDAPNGRIEIELTSVDTDISTGVYQYELLIVDIDGHRYTVDTGLLEILESLARGDIYGNNTIG